MNVAKLFARIGIQADTAPAEKFQKQLGNVKSAMKIGAVAAAGYSAALAKITKDAFAAANALQQFEAETGGSTQELQKWQAVAQQAGGSAQSVSSSIKALSDNQAAIRLGGGNITTFQMLGIDPMEDPIQILEQLAAKTRDLAPSMRKNLLQQAGVSSDMIRTLELTNEEFDEMAGRAFIIPDSAINALDRARGISQQASQAFGYLKTTIAASLAPQIERMSKQFMEFVKTHEEDVIRVVQEGVRYLLLFVDAVKTVAQWIGNVVTSTIGFKAAIVGLIGLFVALNSAVLLPVAGIILLIGLIDDIIAYTEGRKSLIGVLFEKFPALESMFNTLTAPLQELFNLMRSIFSGDEIAMDAILEDWGVFGVLVRYVYDQLKNTRDMLVEMMEGESISEAMMGGPGATPLVGGITQAARGERGWLDAIGEGFSNMFDQSFIGRGIEGMRQSVRNYKTEININGAGDPAAVGAEVERRFRQSTDERGGLVE